MFNVSDKVVCIDDSDSASNVCGFSGTPLIEFGKVYVVRFSVFYGVDPKEHVGLVGIKGKISSSGAELGFAATRFRRLEEIQAENRIRQSVEIARRAHDVERIEPIVEPVFQFMARARSDAERMLRSWVVIYVVRPGDATIEECASRNRVAACRVRELVAEFRSLIPAFPGEDRGEN